MTQTLCPAQEKALAQLAPVLPLFSIIGLIGQPGAGKSTILRHLHNQTGGEFLSIRDLVHALRKQHPLAMEETFEQLVGAALDVAEYVYLDDLWLLSAVVEGSCRAYPRAYFLTAALECLSTQAETAGKKLIYATQYQQNTLEPKGYVAHIGEFKPADYEFYCRHYLGAALTKRLDFHKIHRYARNLDGYDLKTIGMLLRDRADLDTDGYIEALRSFGLSSNVNLAEVRQVTFADLKGVDDVIQSLEANIVLPLEQMELAEALQLRPKRGVLLSGPPGTGKTTIGRALAHRLKSKFFLIDGTFISGTGDFYHRVHQVFEEAKHNAPAIIFLDDSDAIFESGEELGLYRYLLTMLDGLESESAGQVCVMMTAMDVGHLPPALIRSGRIELWLEMRLPDNQARTAILEALVAVLPPAYGTVDVARLIECTGGLTGADLKRLVDDGKNLLAYDKLRGLKMRSVTEYFLEAVVIVKQNKARYLEADERARHQRPARPAYYDP